MKSLNLENRKFDLDKFILMPKCVGSWSKDNSGCLLTAFWYGLGIDLRKVARVITKIAPKCIDYDPNPAAYRHACLALAQKYPDLHSFHSRLVLSTDGLAIKYLPMFRGTSFTQTIIDLYDSDILIKQQQAINLLFKLINTVYGNQFADEIEISSEFCYGS